ncbi:MAG: hypothetical protein ACREMQ_01545 [Longimicrobiales bacterium]
MTRFIAGAALALAVHASDATQLTAQAAVSRLSLKDVLEHPRFDWRTRTTSHFRIHVQPGTLADRRYERLAADVERARAAALTLVADTDHPTIDVFYLSSREEMQLFIGARPKALAVPSHNFVFFVYSVDVRPYHRHEILHLVALDHWGQPAQPADWIVEGLAVFAEGACLEYSIGRIARSLLDQRRVIPIQELIGRFRAHDDLTAYLQAGSFVEHLHRAYGRDALRTVWTRGAAALPDITGKPIDALAFEWQTGLRRDSALARPVDWRRLRREGCG